MLLSDLGFTANNTSSKMLDSKLTDSNIFMNGCMQNATISYHNSTAMARLK